MPTFDRVRNRVRRHQRDITIVAALAFGVVAALLLIAPRPAHAAPGAAAPGGSYLQSCREIAFDGMKLSAQCDSGREEVTFRSTLGLGGATEYWPSELEPARCAAGADIFDANGILHCFARPGAALGGAIPGGSYLQSCRFASVAQGQVLSALCTTVGGDEATPQLDLTLCDPAAGIDNIDGQLVCRPRAAATGSSSAPLKSGPAVDPARQINANLTSSAADGWHRLVIDVWGRRCVDATCRANIYVLAGQMRRDAIADQAAHPDDSSLAVQGRTNRSYGARFQREIDYARARIDPHAAPDTYLLAMGCQHFLGRPAQYLCFSDAAYRQCTLRTTAPGGSACHAPGH